MSEHSPEPWRALLNGDGPHSIADPMSRVVVSFRGGITKADDARRIVACVNACQGLPTEALERGAVADLVRAGIVVGDEGEPAVHFRMGLAALRSALRALGRLP